MKEEWLFPGAFVPVDVETTSALVVEIKRLIDVVGGMALAQPKQQAEMRMPRVGDRVICLEDESLGEVGSLTAGGSPDINFDDGSRGTYMLREFAELFGYVAPPQRPWVGLTPEEVLDLFDKNNVYGSKWIAFNRTVEAALKKKNT